jgi:hypothetical protein
VPSGDLLATLRWLERCPRAPGLLLVVAVAGYPPAELFAMAVAGGGPPWPLLSMPIFLLVLYWSYALTALQAEHQLRRQPLWSAQ